MPLDDRELMLWALAHGWSVKVFAGDPPGSLWKDPSRRRHLVHGTGASPELPALSADVRVRINAARESAMPALQPLPAG